MKNLFVLFMILSCLGVKAQRLNHVGASVGTARDRREINETMDVVTDYRDSVNNALRPDINANTAAITLNDAELATVVTLRDSVVDNISDISDLNLSVDSVDLGWYNVKNYGAVGDGVADDAGAIQAAINAAYADGGGKVVLPPGVFDCSTALEVKDNVHLVGSGDATVIHNTAVGGDDITAMPIITGNLGDITTSSGLTAEQIYLLDAVSPGDTLLTFNSAADATDFTVGEIVLITSQVTYDDALTDTIPVYTNLNVVTNKYGGQIAVKYPLPDTLSVSGSRYPRIRRITGTIDGYGGSPLWAAQNCKVSNLRISQANPGRLGYAIFANGVNQVFENITIDSCASMIGSNGLSYSTIRNIKGNYLSNAADFADYQNDNLIENVIANRYGTRTNYITSLFGFYVLHGCDVTIRNLRISLGGYGEVAMKNVQRGIIENCKILDADDQGIWVGFGSDIIVRGNYIKNTNKLGIYSDAGQRRIITDNIIQDAGLVEAGASVYVWPAGYGGDNIVSNNVLIGDYDHIGVYPTVGTQPTLNDGLFEGNIPTNSNIGIINRRTATVGWHGASGVDYTLPDVANNTAYNLELDNFVPRRSRLIDAQVECTEDVTSSGSAYLKVLLGSTSGGEDLIPQNDCYGNAQTIYVPSPDSAYNIPYSDPNAADIWVGWTALDSDWDTQTAGKWKVAITYIAY